MDQVEIHRIPEAARLSMGLNSLMLQVAAKGDAMMRTA